MLRERKKLRKWELENKKAYSPEYRESVLKRKKSSYEIIKNMRINIEIVIYREKISNLLQQGSIGGKKLAGDGLHKNP